jgi:serine/threonine protein kinase
VEAPSADAAASNRYEILARLATGGMAELFLARATAPDGDARHVVLKRVLPSRTHDPQFVTMFLDEARLAIQLDHPNIVRVFDIGQLGSSYFFTMEYVHGENVRTVLQRVHGLRRRIPLAHAITIAAGAASGLHHAHDRADPEGKPLGIVHRDVSPANIMVGFEGAVKLVDFGVAKATVRSTETRAGTIKGKIAYLSPEQCIGNKPVDRRSDVFALGIVFYELLAVQRLFRRESDFATMAAIVTDEVPPPSVCRPDIPPALDAVVMRALAKAPDQRYPTAGAFLDALEHAARVGGVELSVGGLGQYLKELFGERPEPWIELESLHELPSVVTVTGESMIVLPPDAPVSQLVSPWGGPAARTGAGDVASIEAALIRTVKLHAVPQADDDDFLAVPRPQMAPDPATERQGAATREVDDRVEDRPTVIDDRIPDDLDMMTPGEQMLPVTPTVANRAVTPVPQLTRPGSGPPPPMPTMHGHTPPLQPVHLVHPGHHTPPPQLVPPSPHLTPMPYPPPGVSGGPVPRPPVLPPGYAPAGPPPQPGVTPWPIEHPTSEIPTTVHFGPPPAPATGFVARISLKNRLVLAGIGVIVLALLLRLAVH